MVKNITQIVYYGYLCYYGSVYFVFPSVVLLNWQLIRWLNAYNYCHYYGENDLDIPLLEKSLPKESSTKIKTVTEHSFFSDDLSEGLIVEETYEKGNVLDRNIFRKVIIGSVMIVHWCIVFLTGIKLYKVTFSEELAELAVVKSRNVGFFEMSSEMYEKNLHSAQFSRVFPGFCLITFGFVIPTLSSIFLIVIEVCAWPYFDRYNYTGSSWYRMIVLFQRFINVCCGEPSLAVGTIVTILIMDDASSVYYDGYFKATQHVEYGLVAYFLWAFSHAAFNRKVMDSRSHVIYKIK